MGFAATAALIGMTAVQAVSQVNQGRAQKEEANYNATLLEGKANLIDVQKDIEFGQYQRAESQYLAKSTANIAKAGIMPSGSAMAFVVEQQTQMNIDQAIGQFNLEQQKQYTLAEANQIRRQGKNALRTGYTNAFTTILSGASQIASYKGYGQNSTFDMGGGGVSPKGNVYGQNTPKGVIDTGTYSKYYFKG